eukprot:Clim_evm61s157 gene=Clim_evmTU61s157
MASSERLQFRKASEQQIGDGLSSYQPNGLYRMAAVANPFGFAAVIKDDTTVGIYDVDHLVETKKAKTELSMTGVFDELHYVGFGASYDPVLFLAGTKGGAWKLAAAPMAEIVKATSKFAEIDLDGEIVSIAASEMNARAYLATVNKDNVAMLYVFKSGSIAQHRQESRYEFSSVTFGGLVGEYVLYGTTDGSVCLDGVASSRNEMTVQQLEDADQPVFHVQYLAVTNEVCAVVGTGMDVNVSILAIGDNADDLLVESTIESLLMVDEPGEDGEPVGTCNFLELGPIPEIDDANAIMVLGGSFSSEVELIGRNQDGEWDRVEVREDGIITLPTGADLDDVSFCAGLVADFTAEQPIRNLDQDVDEPEDFPPGARVVLVTQKGLAIPYHFIDLEHFISSGSHEFMSSRKSIGGGSRRASPTRASSSSPDVRGRDPSPYRINLDRITSPPQARPPSTSQSDLFPKGSAPPLQAAQPERENRFNAINRVGGNVQPAVRETSPIAGMRFGAPNLPARPAGMGTGSVPRHQPGMKPMTIPPTPEQKSAMASAQDSQQAQPIGLDLNMLRKYSARALSTISADTVKAKDEDLKLMSEIASVQQGFNQVLQQANAQVRGQMNTMQWKPIYDTEKAILVNAPNADPTTSGVKLLRDILENQKMEVTTLEQELLTQYEDLLQTKTILQNLLDPNRVSVSRYAALDPSVRRKTDAAKLKLMRLQYQQIVDLEESVRQLRATVEASAAQRPNKNVSREELLCMVEEQNRAAHQELAIVKGVLAAYHGYSVQSPMKSLDALSANMAKVSLSSPYPKTNNQVAKNDIRSMTKELNFSHEDSEEPTLDGYEPHIASERLKVLSTSFPVNRVRDIRVLKASTSQRGFTTFNGPPRGDVSSYLDQHIQRVKELLDKRGALEKIPLQTEMLGPAVDLTREIAKGAAAAGGAAEGVKQDSYPKQDVLKAQMIALNNAKIDAKTLQRDVAKAADTATKPSAKVPLGAQMSMRPGAVVSAQDSVTSQQSRGSIDRGSIGSLRDQKANFGMLSQMKKGDGAFAMGSQQSGTSMSSMATATDSQISKPAASFGLASTAKPEATATSADQKVPDPGVAKPPAALATSEVPSSGSGPFGAASAASMQGKAMGGGAGGFGFGATPALAKPEGSVEIKPTEPAQKPQDSTPQQQQNDGGLTSMFGSGMGGFGAASKPPDSTAGGGIFGGAPASGGSVFGGVAKTAEAKPTSSIFGSGTGTGATATATTTGGFGAGKSMGGGVGISNASPFASGGGTGASSTGTGGAAATPSSAFGGGATFGGGSAFGGATSSAFGGSAFGGGAGGGVQPSWGAPPAANKPVQQPDHVFGGGGGATSFGALAGGGGGAGGAPGGGGGGFGAFASQGGGGGFGGLAQSAAGGAAPSRFAGNPAFSQARK